MLSFKKYYDKYGKNHIFLVDEEEVRNQSLKLEEFTNYAIHSDFPDVIPPNEIWLSNRVSEKEKFILIDEALHRIKCEARGMSPNQAYDVALRHDRDIRQKLINSRQIDTPTSNPVSDSVYIKRFGTFKNINIFIVDGSIVRDYYKTDFVEGGHDYVYRFVPWGEIWIDVEVSKEERMFIVIHEIVERELMRDKHMPYEKAHSKASKFEWRLRQKVKNEERTRR